MKGVDKHKTINYIYIINRNISHTTDKKTDNTINQNKHD